MLIRDALIYGEDLHPQKGDLAVWEGKIAAIGEHLDPKAWGEVLDARGARLMPGLVDIHVHGGLGYAVGDASGASLDAISRLLGSQGVTSFCPATNACAPETLEASFRAVGAFMGQERRICPWRAHGGAVHRCRPARRAGSQAHALAFGGGGAASAAHCPDLDTWHGARAAWLTRPGQGDGRCQPRGLCP